MPNQTVLPLKRIAHCSRTKLSISLFGLNEYYTSTKNNKRKIKPHDYCKNKDGATYHKTISKKNNVSTSQRCSFDKLHSTTLSRCSINKNCTVPVLLYGHDCIEPGLDVIARQHSEEMNTTMKGE